MSNSVVGSVAASVLRREKDDVGGVRPGAEGATKASAVAASARRMAEDENFMILLKLKWIQRVPPKK